MATVAEGEGCESTCPLALARVRGPLAVVVAAAVVPAAIGGDDDVSAACCAVIEVEVTEVRVLVAGFFSEAVVASVVEEAAGAGDASPPFALPFKLVEVFLRRRTGTAVPEAVDDAAAAAPAFFSGISLFFFPFFFFEYHADSLYTGMPRKRAKGSLCSKKKKNEIKRDNGTDLHVKAQTALPVCAERERE